jgi:hypothetical protein
MPPNVAKRRLFDIAHAVGGTGTFRAIGVLCSCRRAHRADAEDGDLATTLHLTPPRSMLPRIARRSKAEAVPLLNPQS